MSVRSTPNPGTTGQFFLLFQSGQMSKGAKIILDSLTSPILLLIAEDDPDDRLLTRDALLKGPLAHSFQFVHDGEELMDYLHQRGVYSDPAMPRPSVILLDLNMPRKDGREALEEIKQDPKLRRIPIVVMTTSHAHEDILRSYDLGVNSFIVKPLMFDRLVDVMQSLGHYWFDTVQLPPNEP